MTRVQKGGAIFNLEKLDWLNGYYLRHLAVGEFIKRAGPFISSNWSLTPAIVRSVQDRVGDLSELNELVKFYFELPDYDTNLLRWKDADPETTSANLKHGLKLISKIPEENFNSKFLEEKLLAAIPQESRGDILWPLRVALSGQKASPGPFDILAALGKKESSRRINLALEKINLSGI